MSDQILQTVLLGGTGGFLIWLVIWSIRKTGEAGGDSNKNPERDQRNEGLLSNWSAKLALSGAALGIFLTFAQGYSNVGFMIGFAVPIALVGLILGLVIDQIIKPKKTNIRETSFTTRDSENQISESKKQASPVTSKNSLSTQSSDEDIWAFASHELNSANRNEGLWARSFAHADGDSDKAKAAYLKNRFHQLRVEIQENFEYEKRIAELAEAKRIADLGVPASCPKCGGEIRSTTEACNHCNAWLGAGSKDKPIPK